MFLKSLNVHGGFTPATWLPPNAITPEKVITALSHIAQWRSRGTGTVPSFKAWVLFIFVL